MKRRIIAALVLLLLGAVVQGRQHVVKHRVKTRVVKTAGHEENIFVGLGGKDVPSQDEVFRFLCNSKSGGLKHCRPIESGR